MSAGHCSRTQGSRPLPRGIELIAADKPDAFLDDTPTANLTRQVLGAVSQFEKAMMVSKLKGTRDRRLSIPCLPVQWMVQLSASAVELSSVRPAYLWALSLRKVGEDARQQVQTVTRKAKFAVIRTRQVARPTGLEPVFLP